MKQGIYLAQDLFCRLLQVSLQLLEIDSLFNRYGLWFRHFDRPFYIGSF